MMYKHSDQEKALHQRSRDSEEYNYEPNSKRNQAGRATANDQTSRRVQPKANTTAKNSKPKGLLGLDKAMQDVVNTLESPKELSQKIQAAVQFFKDQNRMVNYSSFYVADIVRRTIQRVLAKPPKNKSSVSALNGLTMFLLRHLSGIVHEDLTAVKLYAEILFCDLCFGISKRQSLFEILDCFKQKKGWDEVLDLLGSLRQVDMRHRSKNKNLRGLLAWLDSKQIQNNNQELLDMIDWLRDRLSRQINVQQPLIIQQEPSKFGSRQKHSQQPKQKVYQEQKKDSGYNRKVQVSPSPRSEEEEEFNYQKFERELLKYKLDAEPENNKTQRSNNLKFSPPQQPRTRNMRHEYQPDTEQAVSSSSSEEQPPKNKTQHEYFKQYDIQQQAHKHSVKSQSYEEVRPLATTQKQSSPKHHQHTRNEPDELDFSPNKTQNSDGSDEQEDQRGVHTLASSIEKPHSEDHWEQSRQGHGQFEHRRDHHPSNQPLDLKFFAYDELQEKLSSQSNPYFYLKGEIYAQFESLDTLQEKRALLKELSQVIAQMEMSENAFACMLNIVFLLFIQIKNNRQLIGELTEVYEQLRALEEVKKFISVLLKNIKRIIQNVSDPEDCVFLANIVGRSLDKLCQHTEKPDQLEVMLQINQFFQLGEVLYVQFKLYEKPYRIIRSALLASTKRWLEQCSIEEKAAIGDTFDSLYANQYKEYVVENISGK